MQDTVPGSGEMAMNRMSRTLFLELTDKAGGGEGGAGRRADGKQVNKIITNLEGAKSQVVIEGSKDNPVQSTQLIGGAAEGQRGRGLT